jgi:hypothetical protein
MAKHEPNLMTLPDPPAVATGDEPIVSSLFCVETSDPFDSYTYRLESIRFSGRTGYQSFRYRREQNRSGDSADFCVRFSGQLH